MKNFLQKTGMVIISTIAVFFLLNILYYKISANMRLVAFEVYDAVDMAIQPTEYTGVVLGDSVARQIFNPAYQEENMDLCYLATNQAIMPAGNYILLEAFLGNNPQVKTVYYVARPDSLQSGINFVYTYSYFVTPMYREAFTEYLNQETREGVEGIFGRFFAKNEFPKWMLGKYPKLLELYNDKAEKLWKMKNNIQDGSMPEMAIPYIAQMQQLCEDKEIAFVLLASPLPEEFDRSSVDEMKRKMELAGMEELMMVYLNSIFYVPQDEFVDGIHMTKEYVARNRGEIIEKMMRQ